MNRWRWTLVIVGTWSTMAGCGSLTPRNFRAMSNPAPVVRAGAVSLGDNEPNAVAIPAWIKQLEDKDTVVRMAANESLIKRTGQDFGFVAWAEPGPRAAAVARWKVWWGAKAKAEGREASDRARWSEDPARHRA